MNRSVFKPVTHVIFDMDGTLIDTEKIHKKVFAEIVREYGKVIPDDLRIQILGRQEIEGATQIVDTLQLEITPEEFLEKARELEKLEMPNVKLMHGVEDLLVHFCRHDIPMAVATSSSDIGFKMKTSHLEDHFAMFHHVVTGSSDPEVKNGKPAPDIFKICASRFPDKPLYSQCLVIEDSPNGVRAAKAAGMQVVMVPDPMMPKELTVEATIVLDSLEDFCPEMFAMPPYYTPLQ